MRLKVQYCSECFLACCYVVARWLFIGVNKNLSLSEKNLVTVRHLQWKGMGQFVKVKILELTQDVNNLNANMILV